MKTHTTYKVTFKETKEQWVFQYRKSDGILHSYFNSEKGSRITKLLANGQFPSNTTMMEEWTKYKELVTIELVLDDYSFDAFWEKYNLKRKKDPSQKAFEKLSLVEVIKCFNALKKYDADLTKTGQAKAHLVTWINQKRYNDEY